MACGKWNLLRLQAAPLWIPRRRAPSVSPIKSLISLRPATPSMPSLQVPVSSLEFLVLSLLRTGRYGPRLPWPIAASMKQATAQDLNPKAGLQAFKPTQALILTSQAKSCESKPGSAWLGLAWLCLLGALPSGSISNWVISLSLRNGDGLNISLARFVQIYLLVFLLRAVVSSR